ncbi:hypothetical protein [Algoriphagus sp. NG3]|uniref:hypothetical protein n=1 Tax=Algoriphagus sp. NG3 TaxID=3097546 RepID=UPI002A8419B4|nr:hypothetical protein [Algoriphagus sp. NG3]WPR74216.1 hypothetical protein SLW71_16215 [Algoriphagus sp. NG3]
MANRAFRESQNYAGIWVMYFILLVEEKKKIRLGTMKAKEMKALMENWRED